MNIPDDLNEREITTLRLVAEAGEGGIELDGLMDGLKDVHPVATMPVRLGRLMDRYEFVTHYSPQGTRWLRYLWITEAGRAALEAQP